MLKLPYQFAVIQSIRALCRSLAKGSGWWGLVDSKEYWYFKNYQFFSNVLPASQYLAVFFI